MILGATGGVGKELKSIFQNYHNDIKIFSYNSKSLNLNSNNSNKKLYNKIKKNNPDIIINASGVFGNNKINYDKIMNINFKSNWNIINFFITNKPKKRVKIFFIGSSSYRGGRKDYMLYSASKAALNSLYASSVQFFNNSKLSIHIINPKKIDTKMIRSFKNINNAIHPKYVAKKIYKILFNL